MIPELKHVLCVDDEDDILEIIQLCLSDIGGLKVTCTSDVENAIERLDKIQPDLILLDVMMPRINGVQAIRLLRTCAGFSDIPIILMTARIQPNEVHEYKASGATAVIAKPFDPMTLADQINEIWSLCHDGK